MDGKSAVSFRIGIRKLISSQHLHHSAFLEEIRKTVIDTKPREIWEATFGRGGHTRMLLESSDAHVVSCDADIEAISYGQNHFQEWIQNKRLILEHRFFDQGWENHSNKGTSPDFFLVDLGISSPQIDVLDRGMSYRSESAVLDLRFDTSQGIPTGELLKQMDPDQIAEILGDYGEIRNGRWFAEKIESLGSTSDQPITAKELADIFMKAGGPSLASQAFQAFRIFVNDELHRLIRWMELSQGAAKPGATMVFISFHSLEDRIIKRKAKELGWKKVSEIKDGDSTNHRLRSAKLRIFKN